MREELVRTLRRLLVSMNLRDASGAGDAESVKRQLAGIDKAIDKDFPQKHWQASLKQEPMLVHARDLVDRMGSGDRNGAAEAARMLRGLIPHVPPAKTEEDVRWAGHSTEQLREELDSARSGVRNSETEGERNEWRDLRASIEDQLSRRPPLPGEMLGDKDFTRLKHMASRSLSARSAVDDLFLNQRLEVLVQTAERGSRLEADLRDVVNSGHEIWDTGRLDEVMDRYHIRDARTASGPEI